MRDFAYIALLKYHRSALKVLAIFALSACTVSPHFGQAQSPIILHQDILGGAVFGYADGLAAKRSAEAICARQGRRLNPAAFGHFNAGAWEFAGGCVANP